MTFGIRFWWNPGRTGTWLAACACLAAAVPVHAADRRPDRGVGPSTRGFDSSTYRGAEPPRDTITIARIRYDGGGDWYADPTSLTNLLAAIAERTGIGTAASEAVVRPLDPAFRDYPYLYMTGHGEVAFSPGERAALRGHLEAGGFLHVDDNYGLDESFREEMSMVFPELELVPLGEDHPVFHSFYSLPEGLPKIHEHDGEPPEALGMILDGRLAVFYSYQSDLGDGWEDEEIHQDEPALREAALRMGVNLFVYALGQSVR